MTASGDPVGEAMRLPPIPIALVRVKDAVLEADLEPHRIPPDCPYALDQLLDEDYLPN